MNESLFRDADSLAEKGDYEWAYQFLLSGYLDMSLSYITALEDNARLLKEIQICRAEKEKAALAAQQEKEEG